MGPLVLEILQYCASVTTLSHNDFATGRTCTFWIGFILVTDCVAFAGAGFAGLTAAGLAGLAADFATPGLTGLAAGFAVAGFAADALSGTPVAELAGLAAAFPGLAAGLSGLGAAALLGCLTGSGAALWLTRPLLAATGAG